MPDYELSQRDKEVLQMTREGLTKENAVTGESENISHQKADYEYHMQENMEEAYNYGMPEDDEEDKKQKSSYKPGSYSKVFQDTAGNGIPDILNEYEEHQIEKELSKARKYERNYKKQELRRERKGAEKFKNNSSDDKGERFKRDSSDGKDEKFKRNSSDGKGEKFKRDSTERKGKNFKKSSSGEEKTYYGKKREKLDKNLNRIERKIEKTDNKAERLKSVKREGHITGRLKFDNPGGAGLKYRNYQEEVRKLMPPVNPKMTLKKAWNTWSESRRKQRDFIPAEIATDLRKGTRYARLIHSKWNRSTRTIRNYTSPQARLKRTEEKAKNYRLRRDEYVYKHLSPEKKEEQKQLRKQMIKKRYQRAAIEKNLLQNQQRVLQNRNFIVKAKDGVVKVVKAAKTTISLISAGITVLMILALLLLGGGFLLALCISYGGDAMIESTYQADYSQISECSAYMRQLETDLQEKISQIEEEYPGYDEYVYNLGEIGHDSIELMSYLAAKFVEFNLSVCQSEIESLFEEMYTLAVDIKEESRKRVKTDAKGNTIYDAEGNPVMESYMAKICYVTLEVKPLRDIIEERLNEEQKKYFDTYMLSSGGQQVYANCLPEVKWGNLISSKFGERIHPITKKRTFHNGIDIAVPVGTSLYSSAEGTVTTSAYSESAGNYIIVTMENGWSIKYMHLDSRNVSVGEHVLKGQFLGKTGNTGNSTGPHLHLEVRTSEDKPIDPTFMIPSDTVIIDN